MLSFNLILQLKFLDFYTKITNFQYSLYIIENQNNFVTKNVSTIYISIYIFFRQTFIFSGTIASYSSCGKYGVSSDTS